MRNIKDTSFCWQEKKALQLIRNNFKKNQLPLAISLYTILTEQASYFWNESYNIFWIKLIEQSWIWYKSYRDIMNKFIELDIIEYKKWTLTKLPLTQEFIYWESYISLLQIGLVQTCTETCTELGQSYKELKEELKVNHSLTSNEVNSFIDNSFTNELLVNSNNDIVELDNKESSFVELNNKNTWIKNSNCKEKENKIKESPFDANEVFDKLWNFYPWKKNAKEAARTYFKKKIKTQYDLDLLRYALPLYISTVSDKNYLVLLRTYLSEERYKDYEQQFKNTNKTLDKEIKQQDNEWFKLKFNRTYEN